ncbi:hypothetical protein ANCDUO_26332, partial [Ancylostoma duodenale]
SASELTQLQTLLGGLRAPGTTGADSSQGNSERQVAVELGDIVAGGQVVETAKNNADRLLSHMPAEDKSSSDTKKLWKIPFALLIIDRQQTRSAMRCLQGRWLQFWSVSVSAKELHRLLLQE